MLDRFQRLMMFAADDGAGSAAPPVADAAATGSGAPAPDASAPSPAADAAASVTPSLTEAAQSDTGAPAADAAPAATDAPKEPERSQESFLADEAGKADADKPKTEDGDKAKDGEKPAEAKKPEADKADAAKPDEAAPGEKPQAPTYAFTLPEGVSLDEKRMGDFTAALGKFNAPPELGQQLVDMHVGEMQQLETRLRESQFETFRKTQDDWRNSIKSDPELGGSRIETTMKVCGSVIEQYGGNAEQQASLRAALKWTGAGNNPDLVRLIHNIGKALGEGEPRPAREPSKPIMSKAERRYANSPKA